MEMDKYPEVPYVHLQLEDVYLKNKQLHETASIRSDLQGLRGWAVLAVVTFHFFPAFLPGGFLGVDVFFVLSGFLIALALHNHPAVDLQSLRQFYFRRLRRIFPLLLMVTLLVVNYYALRFNEMRLFYHMRSALYALTFTSNIKQTDEAEEYFLALEHADDLLTHTWSLAVEVQFYFIAPLLIIIGKKLTCGVGHHFLIYLFLVAFSSFCFHALSEPSTAFNNVFARLWQFILGAFVFNLQELVNRDSEKTQRFDDNESMPTGDDVVKLHSNNKTHDKEKESFKLHIAKIKTSPVLLTTTAACCSLFGLVICIVPATFPRLLVTIAASLAIFLNTTSPFLTHKVIVMLGDCSYSLYLLHWPTVCILKEYNMNSELAKLLAIIICIHLSYLCYIYYEKWFLQLSERETLLLIGGLYLANALVLLHSESPISHFVRDQASPLQPEQLPLSLKKELLSTSQTPTPSPTTTSTTVQTAISQSSTLLTTQPRNTSSSSLTPIISRFEQVKMAEGNKTSMRNLLRRPGFVDDRRRTLKDNKTVMIEWLTDPDGNWTLQDYAQITRKDSTAINARFNMMWSTNLKIPNCTIIGTASWGLCEAPRGEGNLTFMSIGNSYNSNHARLIMKHFRKYYSSIHFHSRGSCFAIDDGTDLKLDCSEESGPMRVVERLKPDVVFVVQRFFSLNKSLDSDIEHDEQFALLLNGTEELAKHTKKIFIMDALPHICCGAGKVFSRGFQLTEENSFSADLLRKRTKELAKRCSNCVLFDLMNPHLTPAGEYMAADPTSNVALFEYSWHHTPYGLKVVEPVFERMASNFWKLFNSSAPFNVLS